MAHVLTIEPPVLGDFFDDAGSNPVYSCILLGLPYEMTYPAFRRFMEPYCMHILRCLLVRCEGENKECHGLVRLSSQVSVVELLDWFRTDVTFF